MEIRSVPTQQIHDTLLKEKGVSLFIRREDLNHHLASGNKWHKLKYNLLEAKKRGNRQLLTFGGAFSNHIYAVAAASHAEGLKAIGIIRGEENLPLNPTLQFAQEKGMQLFYMDRLTYRNKNSPELLDKLKKQHGDFYLIPEGGTNTLAIKGCEEWAKGIEGNYDTICCPVGTGGTMAGLICGSEGEKRLFGFSALNGDFLETDVQNLLQEYGKPLANWEINVDYHFGGYAKVPATLRNFIHSFEEQHQIPVEPIYTAKMLFGIFDLIQRNYFSPGTKLLAIHTGGLQGNKGFDFRKSPE